MVSQNVRDCYLNKFILALVSFWPKKLAMWHLKYLTNGFFITLFQVAEKKKLGWPLVLWKNSYGSSIDFQFNQTFVLWYFFHRLPVLSNSLILQVAYHVILFCCENTFHSLANLYNGVMENWLQLNKNDQE